MTENKVITLANIAFAKISAKYGYSKFHNTLPYLDIDDSPFSDAESDAFGEYDSSENTLVLYWKKIETKEDLIKTILHEYQHYLQSPSWYTRYFKMGYEYSDHPYEIDAYAEELKWETFS